MTTVAFCRYLFGDGFPTSVKSDPAFSIHEIGSKSDLLSFCGKDKLSETVIVVCRLYESKVIFQNGHCHCMSIQEIVDYFAINDKVENIILVSVDEEITPGLLKKINGKRIIHFAGLCACDLFRMQFCFRWVKNFVLNGQNIDVATQETKKQGLDYFNSGRYSSSEFYIPTSSPSRTPEETFVDQYADFVVYPIC